MNQTGIKLNTASEWAGSLDSLCSQSFALVLTNQNNQETDRTCTKHKPMQPTKWP